MKNYKTSMNQFDFTEFEKNISKSIKKTNGLVSQIGDFYWDQAYSFEQEMHPIRIEENDFNLDQLKDQLNQILLKVQFAYEFLGLKNMLDTLNSSMTKHEGKINDINPYHYLDIWYSPVLELLNQHINAILSFTQTENIQLTENQNNIDLLERFLRGTAKLLKDRAIEPTNEKDVRKEIYNTLIHVFPDTVREIPIAKVSKSYKPDIGIKSLKTAIEYKFVDSETEAKSSIGGIFEDIHGYEGSADWLNFYAVIYMTDNFLTIDQINEEFKLSKVPHNWKPIIVIGKGQRKPKLETR